MSSHTIQAPYQRLEAPDGGSAADVSDSAYDSHDMAGARLQEGFRRERRAKAQQKKGKRRRRGGEPRQRGQQQRLYAVCVGKKYDTAKVRLLLRNTEWAARMLPFGCLYCQKVVAGAPAGMKRANSAATDAAYNGDNDADLVAAAESSTQASLLAHAFFFGFGCIVCWNTDAASEQELIRVSCPAVTDPVTHFDSMHDDDMLFVQGSASGILNDEVSLSSRNPIEMYSHSLAFAQSVKLSVYEEEVDDVISESRAYPEALAATGKIPLTQLQVSRKIGELFSVRYKIFLDSSMLDTPEYFWESDEYEPVYQKARAYLETDKRIDVLNQRLDIVRELLDMLANAIENAHANRLEWIILLLIAVEVFLEILFSVIDLKCFHFCGDDDDGGLFDEDW